MANLTASLLPIKSDGASPQAVRTLKGYSRGLVVIDSAAVVEWPPGNKKPKTREIDDLTQRTERRVSGAF